MTQPSAPHTRQLSAGYSLEALPPTVILIVGDQGSGKTSDSIFSFPMGCFIAASGAVEIPGNDFVGWIPNGVIGDDLTVDEVTDLIFQAGKQGYDAVIVDDLSLIADNTLRRLRAQASSSYTFWNMLTDKFLAFRLAGRKAGVHVILNAHPRGTTVSSDGTTVQGGAEFPIKKLTMEIPKLFDSVYHVQVDGMARGDVWPFVYSNKPEDKTWLTKDRHDVAWDKTPLNLREILGSRGYKFRRAPGLEWMDAVVDQGATMLLENTPAVQIEQAITGYMQSLGYQSPLLFEKHLYWVIRDIKARATIHRHLEERSKKRVASGLSLNPAY